MSSLSNTRVDVAKLMQSQLGYLQKQAELWQATSQAMSGEEAPTIVSESQNDRRFADKDWSESPLYSFIKQSYLLNSRLLTDTLDSMEFEEQEQSEKLKFFTRQYINALSPTNTLLGNPEVYRKTLDSKGQNLQAGMENLIRDWQQSPQQGLKMTQTDESAFKVGENLATTPGSVIYQNDIMQLIQYAPATKKVFETPILITPPYINKYYVLDLDEKKSLVRWLVNKGFTVFMISWVNPDVSLAHKSFGDYVMQGPVEALNVIREITATEKAHLMGYCVGGTLASMTAALLKAQGRDCLESLTLLTTLLDFSKPGEVGHYLSESSWASLKQQVQTQGFMDGRTLAMGFSLLRENQLFWPNFIKNYLKGESPEAFDILYWNSDSTHITAANYVEYIETTYLHNRLKEPDVISRRNGRDCLASLTLLTTLLDFSKPGEVGHYLSESSWASLKQQVQTQGFMDGRTLAMGFSLLRENQLFWPNFIKNYLKGESPEAFDILYWNSDSTHITAANYVEYIETTYLHNRLKEPGGFAINGTPIDLSAIDVPVYFLAAQSDHIVLWDAAYQGAQLLTAPSRFVLAGSGHLAGVINPEHSGKYGYRTNDDLTQPAQQWLEGADEHDDSWWPDWFAWSQADADKNVMARKVGSKAGYSVLEAAPGSYVQRRI